MKNKREIRELKVKILKLEFLINNPFKYNLETPVQINYPNTENHNKCGIIIGRRVSKYALRDCCKEYEIRFDCSHTSNFLEEHYFNPIDK